MSPRSPTSGWRSSWLETRNRPRAASWLERPATWPPSKWRVPRRSIGPSTDIYALGAILYEALTGRPPFRGESPMATMLQVKACDVVSPRRLRPNLPRDLETICLKSLEKDPRRRYPTAWIPGRRPTPIPGRSAHRRTAHPRLGAALALDTAAEVPGGGHRRCAPGGSGSHRWRSLPQHSTWPPEYPAEVVKSGARRGSRRRRGKRARRPGDDHADAGAGCRRAAQGHSRGRARAP